MKATVPYRHLWSPERLTATDLNHLISTAETLRRAQQHAAKSEPLRGRHVALLCGPGNDAAPVFQRAVSELGGTPALLNADEWRVRAGDRIPEAARLLGRLYDAIDCCDLPTEVVEQIEAFSGVPVLNGLASPNHPMASLADLLTMREATDKPLHGSRLEVTDPGSLGSTQPALALARLAGMQAAHRDSQTSLLTGPSTTEPDFVLDARSSATNRLTQPHVSVAQQAELNGMQAINRQCALQAAIVCSLQ
jgi:ornithine carbamoyltransferase